MNLMIDEGPGQPPELDWGEPVSHLQRVLRSGRFAVTGEFNPPDSANPEDVFVRAQPFLKGFDAVNVTDSSGANPHMSSFGVCVLLLRLGLEPVFQISCRDRNRIAMQGEVLGAAANGIRNVLCLTGDGVQAGDHPDAKPVFDLDCMGLIETVRMLRDRGTFLSGRKLKSWPKLMIGGAANPFMPPHDFRPYRLAKKVAAGAQFVQTQYCFDLPLLERYMAKVRELGLPKHCSVLVGCGPLASAGAARWIRSNVPGVHIPNAVVERLEGAADPKAEGRRICIEMIQAVREIPGVAGVHIMAHKQEKFLPEILEGAGLLEGGTETTSPTPSPHLLPLAQGSLVS